MFKHYDEEIENRIKIVENNCFGLFKLHQLYTNINKAYKLNIIQIYAIRYEELTFKLVVYYHLLPILRRTKKLFSITL